MGFQTRIETIKKQLKRYQVIIKWLRLCDYFPGEQGELSIEQEVLRHFLRDYAYVDKQHVKCIREHRSEKYWREKLSEYKELLEYYKKDCDWWRERTDWWSSYATLQSDEKPEELQETHQPQRKGKVYPFNVVDGGKKFEEQPPFANL